MADTFDENEKIVVAGNRSVSAAALEEQRRRKRRAEGDLGDDIVSIYMMQGETPLANAAPAIPSAFFSAARFFNFPGLEGPYAGIEPVTLTPGPIPAFNGNAALAIEPVEEPAAEAEVIAEPPVSPTTPVADNVNAAPEVATAPAADNSNEAPEVIEAPTETVTPEVVAADGEDLSEPAQFWEQIQGFEGSSGLLDPENPLIESDLGTNPLIVEQAQQFFLYSKGTTLEELDAQIEAKREELEAAGGGRRSSRIRRELESLEHDRHLAGSSYEDLTVDERQDLANEAMWNIGWFNNNTAAMGKTLFDLTTDESIPDEQKLAFQFFADVSQNTSFTGNFWKKAGRFAWQGIATDPLTIGSVVAGFFTFGTATVGAQAAIQTSRVAGMTALRTYLRSQAGRLVVNGVVRGATVGAVEGMVDGQLSDQFTQRTRMTEMQANVLQADGTYAAQSIQRQEEFSLTQNVMSTGIGAAAGAGFSLVGSGARVVWNRNFSKTANNIAEAATDEGQAGRAVADEIDNAADNVATLSTRTPPEAVNTNTAIPEQQLRYAQQDANIERGGYSPAQGDAPAKINLFHTSNASTFVHESGHYFLDTLHRLVDLGHAPDELGTDLDKILSWGGIAGDTQADRLANWNAMSLPQRRDAHERFARGLESYIRDGVLPENAPVGLKRVFSKFVTWIKDIYRNADDLESLPPEIREVMDRMVGHDNLDQAAITRLRNEMLNDPAYRDSQIDNAGENAHLLASFYGVMAQRSGVSIDDLKTNISPLRILDASQSEYVRVQEALASLPAEQLDQIIDGAVSIEDFATFNNLRWDLLRAEDIAELSASRADLQMQALGQHASEALRDGNNDFDFDALVASRYADAPAERVTNMRNQFLTQRDGMKISDLFARAETDTALAGAVEDVATGNKTIQEFLNANGIDFDSLPPGIKDSINDGTLLRQLQENALEKRLNRAMEDSDHSFNLDEAIAKYPGLEANTDFVTRMRDVRSTHYANRNAVLDLMARKRAEIEAKPENSRSQQEREFVKAYDEAGVHQDIRTKEYGATENPSITQADGRAADATARLQAVDTAFTNLMVKEGANTPRLNTRPSFLNSYVMFTAWNPKNASLNEFLRIAPWRMPVDSLRNIKRGLSSIDSAFTENHLNTELWKLQNDIKNLADSIGSRGGPTLDEAKEQAKTLLEDFVRDNEGALLKASDQIAFSRQGISTWKTTESGSVRQGITSTQKASLLDALDDSRKLLGELLKPDAGTEGNHIASATSAEELTHSLSSIMRIAADVTMRAEGKDPRTGSKVWTQYQDATARAIQFGHYFNGHVPGQTNLPTDPGNFESLFDVNVPRRIAALQETDTPKWDVPDINAFGLEIASLIKGNMAHEAINIIREMRWRLEYKNGNAWKESFIQSLTGGLDSTNPYHQYYLKQIEKYSTSGNRAGGGLPGFFGIDHPLALGGSGGRFMNDYWARQTFLLRLRDQFKGSSLNSTPFNLTVIDRLVYDPARALRRHFSGQVRITAEDGSISYGWSNPNPGGPLNLVPLVGKRLNTALNSTWGTPVRIGGRIFFAPEMLAYQTARGIYNHARNPLLAVMAAGTLAGGIEEGAEWAMGDNLEIMGWNPDILQRTSGLVLTPIEAGLGMIDTATDIKIAALESAGWIEGNSWQESVLRLGGAAEGAHDLISSVGDDVSEYYLGDHGNSRLYDSNTAISYDVDEEIENLRVFEANLDTYIDASTTEGAARLQALQTLIPTLYTQQQEKSANITTLEADLDIRRSELERLENLSETRAMNAAEAARHEINLADAQNNLSTTENNLNAARHDYNYEFGYYVSVLQDSLPQIHTLQTRNELLAQQLNGNVNFVTRQWMESELQSNNDTLQRQVRFYQSAVDYLSGDNTALVTAATTFEPRVEAPVVTPGTTTGAPPAGTTGTPPAGTTGTPPAGTTGTPPAGTTGTPPAGTAGTTPPSAAELARLAEERARVLEETDRLRAARSAQRAVQAENFTGDAADEFKRAVGPGVYNFLSNSFGMAGNFISGTASALFNSKNPLVAGGAALLAGVFGMRFLFGEGPSISNMLTGLGKLAAFAAIALGAWAMMRPNSPYRTGNSSTGVDTGMGNGSQAGGVSPFTPVPHVGQGNGNYVPQNDPRFANVSSTFINRNGQIVSPGNDNTAYFSNQGANGFAAQNIIVAPSRNGLPAQGAVIDGSGHDNNGTYNRPYTVLPGGQSAAALDLTAEMQ